MFLPHTTHTHMQLQTLNLFELSQQFSQTGPHWLKESGGAAADPSPHLTPAPPPTARGFYHHAHLPSSRATESAVLSEEGEGLDYGGGISGRMGHKAQYAAQNRTK